MAAPQGTGGSMGAEGGLGRVPNRGPGWLARGPAMVRLNAPLAAFRSLRPLVQPAVSLAQKIFARWTAPVFVTGWHGALRLERQVAARGMAVQRVFHRLTERWTDKGQRRSAFQPLSLPHEFLEPETTPPFPAFEEEPGPETLQDFGGEGQSAGQPEEAGRADGSLLEPSIPSRAEGSQAPLADQPVLRPAPMRTESHPVYARSSTAQPARQAGQPPQWPFQLVNMGAEPIRRNPAQPTHPGQERRPETVLAHKSQAVSRAVTNLGESARPGLEARPLLQNQAWMPVTSVRLPASNLGEEVSRAEEQPQSAQWRSGQFPSGSEGGPPVFASTSAEQRAARAGTRAGQAATVVMRYTQSLAGSSFSEESRPEMLRVQPVSAMLALSRSERVGVPPTPGLAPRSPRPEEREWPLFGVLRQLARPPETGESTALQILRRMWPEAESSQLAGAAHPAGPVLQASAELGPGEALQPELRRAMEGMTGRDLGEVRLHTSPLAQTLRAEAFTSGRHVVFAPGRFDPGTPSGLALLGHELTHLGQPLAFKQEGTPTAGDDHEERAARTQEERIQQVIEKGWPEAPRRELRHDRRSESSTAPLSGIQMVQRSVQIDEMEVSTPVSELAANRPVENRAGSGGEAAPGQAGAAAGAQPPAQNVDALARQVYAILKDRLRSERERHRLYDW